MSLVLEFDTTSHQYSIYLLLEKNTFCLLTTKEKFPQPIAEQVTT